MPAAAVIPAPIAYIKVVAVYHFGADGSKHIYIPGTSVGWRKVLTLLALCTSLR